MVWSAQCRRVARRAARLASAAIVVRAGQDCGGRQCQGRGRTALARAGAGNGRIVSIVGVRGGTGRLGRTRGRGWRRVPVVSGGRSMADMLAGCARGVGSDAGRCPSLGATHRPAFGHRRRRQSMVRARRMRERVGTGYREDRREVQPDDASPQHAGRSSEKSEPHDSHPTFPPPPGAIIPSWTATGSGGTSGHGRINGRSGLRVQREAAVRLADG